MHKQVFILSVLLLCSSGCQNPYGLNHATRDPTPGALYSLSEGQRHQLEELSRAGDADASFRLYEYFFFTATDYPTATLWVRRAAEQGLVLAQYNLASILLRESERDPTLKSEAVEWLKKAAAGGDEYARRKLAELARSERR